MTVKKLVTNSEMPIIQATSTKIMYFCFSAAIVPFDKEGMNDNTINSAKGIAVPTPFIVRPSEIVVARSSGIGVMMLGNVQNGTSETV